MSEINKYIPGIRRSDVRRGRAGVRAQAPPAQRNPGTAPHLAFLRVLSPCSTILSVR